MLIGRRNLSKEDRDELIRRLAAAGHRQKDIAQAVGMTEARISQITKGKNLNNLSENPIKSTSAAEELEAKRTNADKRQAVGLARSGVANIISAGVQKGQVPEVTKSELTVTAKLKDELASMQPVARKRTPRFKASFNVSRET